MPLLLNTEVISYFQLEVNSYFKLEMNLCTFDLLCENSLFQKSVIISQRWLLALKTTLRDIEIDLDENDVSIGYFPLRCNYNFLFLLLGLLKPKCLRLRVLEGEPENVERILSYCAVVSSLEVRCFYDEKGLEILKILKSKQNSIKDLSIDDYDDLPVDFFKEFRVFGKLDFWLDISSFDGLAKINPFCPAKTLELHMEQFFPFKHNISIPRNYITTKLVLNVYETEDLQESLTKFKDLFRSITHIELHVPTAFFPMNLYYRIFKELTDKRVYEVMKSWGITLKVVNNPDQSIVSSALEDKIEKIEVLMNKLRPMCPPNTITYSCNYVIPFHTINFFHKTENVFIDLKFGVLKE